MGMETPIRCDGVTGRERTYRCSSRWRTLKESTPSHPTHTTRSFLYTTHPTSCDSELTHAKVLSQERSHIPLMWLARKNAQYGGASNSVLVDSGTKHTPNNHTTQPMCPSLNYFIFSFSFFKYHYIHNIENVS